MSEGRLGRRLSDLLGAAGPVEETSSEVLYGRKREDQPPAEVQLSLIDANPFQPRSVFDRDELEALKNSILASGILQPILVRAVGERYQVVVGERRLRAAQELKLERIPAVVRPVSDQELLELALVENIQRADLNPIEKAKAYRRLMQEFGLTQEHVAQRVGQDRSTVANFVRLLELPKDIQDGVSRGTLAVGHARALLALEGADKQRDLAGRVANQGLSVRQTERLVSASLSPRRRRARGQKSAQVRSLEDRLKRHLGTRITIYEGKKRGRIVIEFYGPDDFDRLMQLIGLPGHD